MTKEQKEQLKTIFTLWRNHKDEKGDFKKFCEEHSIQIEDVPSLVYNLNELVEFIQEAIKNGELDGEIETDY